MSIKSLRTIISVELALGAALVLASCAPQQVRTASKNPASSASDTVDVSTMPPVNVTEASLRGPNFVSVPDLAPIYFEYDKAELQGDARETLKKNADYLKEHADLDAQIAGSCDERGTVEYNLALGQRRAKAVRDYYINLGVPGERLATISYGKEKPTCSEHNEECWSKNRRAETLARARADASSADSSSSSQ